MGRALARSRSEPQTFARELFADLPARYDRLAELLSFGQNGRWRRTMIDAVARSALAPRRVLDVATGTAGVALALCARTGADVVGVDITPQMLRQGLDRVSRDGRGDQIRLVAASAERLPFPDASFDALTFTYLLRYVADPAATLRELTRVLRAGGTMASLEFAVPDNRFWRYCWIGYTRALLPAAGLVTGGRRWFEVGRFLGPSISEHYRTYPLTSTVQAWQDAGMVDVTVQRLSLGGGVVMSGRKATE